MSFSILFVCSYKSDILKQWMEIDWPEQIKWLYGFRKKYDGESRAAQGLQCYILRQSN